MTEIMLRGALSALKTKIEALANSEAATAEDLAMLGTAFERIAGKTTAVELEMVGDEQRAALAAASGQLRDELLHAISVAVSTAEADVAAKMAQLDSALSAAVAELADAANAAASTPSALTPTSFFYNQL